MKESYTKFVIIGAGLSGLTIGHQLFQSGQKDFVVLEARDRIGGRIMTKDGIDLGATWFQSHHHEVSKMLEDLKLEKFHQYNKGRSVLVYSTMAPEHYFENDPSAPSAYRIVGNSMAMINTLAKPFKDRIHLGHLVTDVHEDNDTISVITNEHLFKAEKVIVAAPPRIALKIRFMPELPAELISAMETTHTWMSNAIKVGLTFEKPFWRAKNLSGMVIGQVGAVTELYDHSNAEDNRYALMGFVNEGLRDFSKKDRKDRILNYLAKYLGEEVLIYKAYVEKDWSQDSNTCGDTIKSIYMSPSYGNKLFVDSYMNDRLLFSGAETSALYGGYMDGAIHSGLLTANKLVIKKAN